MSEMNVHAERKAAAERVLASAMATDAAMAEGIAKSQERLLTMKKRQEVPGPAQVSPEIADKILAGSTIGGFCATPWAKPAPADDVITKEPTLLLPLPVSLASLQDYADVLKTTAEMLGFTTGRVEVLESSNLGHVLLRWVTT